MIKTLFSVFSFVVLLSSCTAKSMDAELVYETMRIPIDFPYISDYGKISACWKGEAIVLGGYNYKTHALDLFDLSQGKTMASLTMETQGVNEINDIQSFALSTDRILVKNMLGVKMFSWELNLLRSFPLQDFRDDSGVAYQAHPQGIRVGNYNRLYYKTPDHLLLPIYPSGVIENGKGYQMCLYLDMEKGIYSFSDIMYPEDFPANVKKYGNLTFPLLTETDNKLIYAYPHTSAIYTYDKRSREIEKFTPEGTLALEEATSLPQASVSIKESLKYQLNAPRFLEVNPYEDYFFRIYMQPVNEGKDIQAYLILLDKSFDVIREFVLPANFTQAYAVCDYFLYFLIKDEQANPDEYLSVGVIDLLKNTR